MKSIFSHRQSMHGFSLIELMVAMVIGLIILAAISTVLVNSNKAYNTTDSMARLQENARFAMQFIGTDLRRAGYFGCTDDIESVNSTLNGASLGGTGGLAVGALEGAENIATGGTWLPSGNALALTDMIDDTDAVAIRYLDLDNPIVITQPMPNESAVLFVNKGHGLVTGDIIAVSDCDSVDIMQLTNVQDAGGGGKDNLVHNAGTTNPTPGNSTQKLSKSYGAGTTVFKFASYAYYIGTGAGGQRALFRTSSAVSQELVEGVDDLQVTYGEVTTSDRVPSVYRKATDVVNWGNVISVRIGIVASSIANTKDGQYGTETDTTGTYTVNDAVVGPYNDKRIRKVFMSTYTLRNIK
jgi:type IV pilus assembly protein PilW